jgi:hypothetical protein
MNLDMSIMKWAAIFKMKREEEGVVEESDCMSTYKW